MYVIQYLRFIHIVGESTGEFNKHFKFAFCLFYGCVCGAIVKYYSSVSSVCQPITIHLWDNSTDFHYHQ